MPTNAQTRPESAIHTDLIRKIMNKELQPGQRLPEAELVGVCALSRTPIPEVPRSLNLIILL